MKISKVILSAVVILLFCSSCFSDRKQKVDAFYTTRNYGQFPLLPLLKPVKLTQNDQSLEWGIDFTKYSFKSILSISKLEEIGIDSVYIYGLKTGRKWNLEDYEKGNFVYAKKYGGVSWSEKPLNIEGFKQIYIVDSTKNIFIEPDRYFVLNVADATTETFFSKTKYEDYLREKKISGKMYNINKYHKEYKGTGILPWFPDSIKVKLKK